MLAAYSPLHCVLKIDSNKLESEGEKSLLFSYEKMQEGSVQTISIFIPKQQSRQRPHMQINLLTTSAHMLCTSELSD